jgi:hypothetical protein
MEQGDRSFRSAHHEREETAVEISPVEIQDGAAGTKCLGKPLGGNVPDEDRSVIT